MEYDFIFTVGFPPFDPAYFDDLGDCAIDGCDCNEYARWPEGPEYYMELPIALSNPAAAGSGD